MLSIRAGLALLLPVTVLAHGAVGGPAGSTDAAESGRPGGVVQFIDPVRAAPAAASRPVPMPRKGSFPDAETFRLHSKPDSRRTILLDFDGTDVTGTKWNDDGLPPGPQRGWSLDGDHSSFSSAERAFIQEVFLVVAEDFAPFDVDVTTEDPDPGDPRPARIERSGPEDQVFGVRVAISDDPAVQEHVCQGRECSGTALLDAFDEPDSHAWRQPAWVFAQSQAIQPPDARAIRAMADTISHEVGHTFGLLHDGTSDEEYYHGHGLWAPIMGFSDFAPVSQWSDGSYAGANQQQDDLAIIAANGAPLRTDRAGSTVLTAAPVHSGNGYITTRTDVDVWALGTCSGTVKVTASVAAYSPNLDVRLEVLDAGGAVLGSADPPAGEGNRVTASGMGASLSVQVEGEPLFASVDGVGRGSASEQYDDYGSLGAYRMFVSGCTGDSGGEPEPVATVPQPPRIGKATPGSQGAPLSAGISWKPPKDDGGARITGYTVLALQLDRDGSVARTLRSERLPASARKGSYALTKGRWAFQVVATNAEGNSEPSRRSKVVKPR